MYVKAQLQLLPIRSRAQFPEVDRGLVGGQRGVPRAVMKNAHGVLGDFGRPGNEVFAARGQGDAPNTPVFGTLDPATELPHR